MRAIMPVVTSGPPQFAILAASDGGIMQWVSVHHTREEAEAVIEELIGNDDSTDEALFIVPLTAFVQFA